MTIASSYPLAPNAKTVVVGMSGGVDSSVAALLLLQQGYRVIGVFMKNWDEQDEQGTCTSAQDFRDVETTCATLGIPCLSVNFTKEYWDGVFAHFLADYQAGHTPNPDILCNKEIKFKVFYQKALELGADYVATGHYCQVIDNNLHKGVDPEKDQSYFLSAIDGSTLARVLFPVGALKKTRVRELAHQFNLPTREKKESMGICFIGPNNFSSFITRYIKKQPGPFMKLSGEVVGQHLGIFYYTVGQRKHLGLGGEGSRWYVVKKDIERNIVFVERDHLHPALYSDVLYASDWVGINFTLPDKSFSCTCKIRHRQKDQECVVEKLNDGRIRVTFAEPQRAIALRQAIAFYLQDRCLGGAIISEVGPSYYDMAQPLPDSLRSF